MSYSCVPVQEIVSVNTVRQIPIVLAMKVVVATNVKSAPIAWEIIVPSTLIAKIGTSPVVTEYASLMIAMMPSASLLVQ